jgi:hypothetical protein
MSGKNTAVFGIYPSYPSVEMGVDGLKAAGFSNRDISVLLPESAGSRDFAHEKGTKAPEGATTGAGTGVVLGGAMGWLLGVGALAIPGWGRSSRRDRSWRPSRARASEARLVASPEP